VGVDDAELRQVILTKLGLGHLPRKPPAKIYAGPGTGQLCAVCGSTVRHDATEYEFDVEGRSVWMHRPCFTAWTRELARA
jgi:hypothetical protein